jgi:hypothetical protein
MINGWICFRSNDHFFATMNELTVLFPETLPDKDYQDLYRAVCVQLDKDFMPHARLKAITDNISPDWIYNEIHRMLQEIISRGGSELGAVVYRVDLKETLVRKTMHESTSSDRINELANMILKREAQKVWLRKHLRT